MIYYIIAIVCFLELMGFEQTMAEYWMGEDAHILMNYYLGYLLGLSVYTICNRVFYCFNSGYIFKKKD